jgi:dihydroorotate dehydrogenase
MRMQTDLAEGRGFDLYRHLLRPLFFRLSPDRAHDVAVQLAGTSARIPGAISALRLVYQRDYPSLQQTLFGLSFPNPVGIAAGFDKNAVCIPFLQALGLGFIEIGSVTAQARPGNPRPRSFRLPADESLINRLGLNNDGAQTVCRRLAALGPPLRRQLTNRDVAESNSGQPAGKRRVPIGVNIAKTHDPRILGAAAHADYAASFAEARDVADFITLNISCPNTAEGKTFEEPEALAALLAHLDLGNDPDMPPVLVKLSPDLSQEQIGELVDLCRKSGISGFVATNTSTQRTGLHTSAEELADIGAGGLSGQAIRDRATRTIQAIAEATGGDLPIIGVGGIASAAQAFEKIEAGANLVQIYTGLVYEGPRLIGKINNGLAKRGVM